ncbi:hypothetical protein BN1723_011323 [Verticillium longisporum]|nr:hypothetical protein BN1723_011323 [Verticillium longisporum]
MRFLSNMGGLLLVTTGAQAFFVVPCSRPVVVQRADPIVNPGALAGHVHTIMGGSAFNFTMGYDDAVSSACSTCKVRQDLSNYWTPNLYYESENGKFEAVKQLGGMLVYYLQRSDSRDPEYENGLLAFPPGFQMLAGDPSLRSFGDTLEQRAISYVCLGVSGPETHQFPSQNCPYGLRVQVMFPSCWDGHNLDSPNHKSHMAYPSLVDNGVCPTSHPKRFITLFYEVTFQIDDFKDKWYKDTPPFVYSNGDPTGYGLHGDFVNGWDTDVLQSAITNCTDASGSLNRCPLLHQFDDETMKGCRVPVRVEEQVDGILNRLPGCNPVQRGPGRATQQSGCGATTTISPPQWPYTDMTISHRFRYRGCAPDASGKSRTLNGTDVSSDNMTVARCLEYCDERGFKYAGVEYRRECFCGNFVDHDREPKKGILGVCELPCTGDNNEVCGGYGGISLYEKCSAGAACENADLDIDTKEPLPGFENGLRAGMTTTDMVRCRSLVEQSRILVMEVLSSNTEETDDADLDDGGESDTDNDRDALSVANLGTGQGSTAWVEDDEARLSMDVVRVYENTIVQLGNRLGDTLGGKIQIGIGAEDHPRPDN